MNNKQRKKLQRAVEHRAMKLQQQGFERRIVSTLSRCSLNVARATSAPSLREKHESTSQCLPQVSIYAAGYRKSKDIVTAR
ncbi:transcriptional regulator [Pantoea piersonii]|uniref:Transcriptional regulator n=1 Tax=Pantoea piersonii TaxID=2364647 RepID=A0AAJ5QHJ2_9GAMM|nr:transcriptional regulator [Pantoea piersonii]WBG90055.1 transcriptional regulator [Pantoea piersonii]